MKKLRGDQYLIEGFHQLDIAIQDYCKQCRIDYNPNNIFYGEPPKNYPFVAIMGGNEDSGYIRMEYVTPTDFHNHDEAGSHLFEFHIRRAWNISPYRVYESNYQIPASSFVEAVMMLGQTFNDDTEYELSILSWNQVK